MKNLLYYFVFFFIMKFSVLCEDLYYKTLIDADLYQPGSIYFKSENIVGTLNKNDIILFADNYVIARNDSGDKTRKMMGYYIYVGTKYVIQTNNLIPINTERRFNHLFLTDLNSPDRKTWIPAYYADVLKNYRDLLHEYNSFWADPYNTFFEGGEGERGKWHEVYESFLPGCDFTFTESAMSFDSIPFAIKNIKKIPNGYTVTVKFGKQNWRMYQLDSYNWSPVEDKEFFDITFIVDGDYMDMYLDNGTEPFITFISVDLNFLEQFASRIKYDEADLSNVTFPRRGYKTAIVGEMYKTTDDLRMRNSAGTDGNIITTIAKGNTVKIIEIGKKETIENIEANWVRAQLADGQEGWVFGGYLETLPE